jgi:hypothetical protein
MVHKFKTITEAIREMKDPQNIRSPDDVVERLSDKDLAKMVAHPIMSGINPVQGAGKDLYRKMFDEFKRRGL